MASESKLEHSRADMPPIQVVEKYLSILKPNDGEVSREFIEESSELVKALLMLEKGEFDEYVHGKIIQLGELLYSLEDNAYKKAKELRQNIPKSREYEETRKRGQFWREMRYRADSAVNKIVSLRKKQYSTKQNKQNIAVC